MRGRLAWGQRKFEQVRNEVVAAGHAEKGRGRGFRTRLAITYGGPTLYGDESALYEPFCEAIEDHCSAWSVTDTRDPNVVEITAQQGARRTGGTWTRPDITAITVAALPLAPAVYFDVMTFEVKPAESFDVKAIYEALTHRRAATRSYVLVHGLTSELERERARKVSDVAADHGIGLAFAGEPDDDESWEEVVSAVRHDPGIACINDFLEQQLPEDGKTRLRAALHRAITAAEPEPELEVATPTGADA